MINLENSKQSSILFLVYFAGCMTLAGQPDFLKKVSNYPNEIIEETVKPALVILRQDYLLYDANDSSIQYTRGGKDSYGFSYTVGLISGTRIWTNKNTIQPWLLDDNYKERNANSVTKLGHYALRSYDNKHFSVIGRGISAKSSYGKFIVNYPLWDKERLGLKRYNNWNKTSLDGWVVLAYSDRSLMEVDTAFIKYAIYKEEIQLVPNQQEVLIDPKVKSNLIGGVYLVPEYEVGQVSFKIAGILMKKPAVFSWFIQLFEDYPSSKPMIPNQITDFPIRIRFVDKHEKPYKNQVVKIQVEDSPPLKGLINGSGILTLYADDAKEKFISLNDVGALYTKSDDKLNTLLCKKTIDNILIPIQILVKKRK